MIPRITIADTYLALWCLYLLQGTLYDSEAFMGKILLVIILLVSISYTIYAIFYNKLPSYFKALNALLIMFSIYGFLHILTGTSTGWQHIPTFYYIKDIYLAFLPIYFFYVNVRQGKFDERKLKVWIFIFFAVATASYYKTQFTFDGQEKTNNIGYVFLSLLPITTIYKNKRIVQILLLSYCSFFMIISMKRGAILIGVAVLLLLLYDILKGSSNIKTKTISLILVVSLFMGITYYVEYLLAHSDFFVFRINQTMEGDSSTRDVIYSNYYDFFINQIDAFSLFFGNGADATIRLLGNYAHNDWLEIAINNGILGIILYSVYFICFFKAWHKIPRHTIIKVALGTSLLILFAKSFFSMSYFITPVYTSCLIGYCMAMKEKPIKKIT